MSKKTFFHQHIFKVIPFLLCLLTIFFLPPVIAQTPTPNTSSIEQTIVELQKKINDLQGQEDTFTKQITLLDSQISVTQLRVQSISSAISKLGTEITGLAGEIDRLEGLLNRRSELVLKRIPESYKQQQVPLVNALFFSTTFSDLLRNVKYITTVQEDDAQLMFQLKATQNNFSDRKNLRESKRKQQETLQSELQNQNKQLESQKQQKQTLLKETQGSEVTYQKLLTQAKAQLAGFDTFVTSQGGGSLLSNQTYCSDWGCYYNQRDVLWGKLPLNHTRYTIASDGCLVTAMAMVMTHYGHKVTPVDINNNPENFASYYPAYLLYTTTVNGVTADRIGATIDAMLSKNEPVIVGLHAYGGTHFVVLKSGSSGNYKMYDPYIENGHDISFSDHYSVRSIFEINKVVIR